MTLQLRTKDNLDELLKSSKSPAWVIADYRVAEISQIEIYQFDGKRVLKADFDAANSARNEDDRLIVAFSNGKIVDCDFDWNGQNPVKYQISDLALEISEDQKKWIEEKSAYEYEQAPLEWLSDRIFILHALKEQPLALQYANKSLKSDKDIVESAVLLDGEALEFADDSLKSHRAIVLTAVKNNGASLEFASETLKADKEIVLEAVKNAGYAIQFAAESIKQLKEIVEAAVGNDGSALEFANDQFKNDKEIVALATANTWEGSAFRFAGDKLKNDISFVSTLFEKIKTEATTNFFNKLPIELKKNDEIVNKALPHFPGAKNYLIPGTPDYMFDYYNYFDGLSAWGNIDIPSFSPEKKIKLSQKHFAELEGYVGLLCFTFENSNEAWEEQGGGENFEIIYELSSASILPYTKQAASDGNFKMSLYLNSKYVSLYQPFVDSASYDGIFSVSNYLNSEQIKQDSFSLCLHGTEITDSNGLSEEKQENYLQIFSTRAVYNFLHDVLSQF